MNFDSFLSDLLATLVGSILLATLFFLLREKVFGYKELDGSWVYEQKTITSAFNPYMGMTVTFLVLLARDGNRIYGSAEKISDKTSYGKKREYVGKDRSRAEIQGHIEKRYFSRDRISIHIVENSVSRTSSTFHILECINDKNMEGRFSSTISNQTGEVVWTRRSS